MITGGRIDAVEGKKLMDGPLKGLNINIAISDIKIDGQKMEIVYSYSAVYADNLGDLKIKGALFTEEDKKLVKDVETEWKKSKKLPVAYAEIILNAINYSGSANGTLLARVLNLSPPLVPPRIALGDAKKQG